MPQIEQPMLAAEFSPEKHLSLLPLYATPKVDGIRFYVKAGRVWTRANKPLPNKSLRLLLPCILPEGTDGEITASEPNDPIAFQKATSLAMGVYSDITPTRISLFDYVSPSEPDIAPYFQRIADLAEWWRTRTQLTISAQTICNSVPLVLLGEQLGCSSGEVVAMLNHLRSRVTILQPTACRKPSHPEKFLATCLAQGYEGIMLRLPHGGYKFGRSTQDEALLLKYKPWADSEATIIDFEELMHNDNEQFCNELGKSKRSSASDGKRPGGVLGSFLVQECKSGLTFSVGGGKGFTQALRSTVWNNREAYTNAVIKYRYLAAGTKPGGAPRMPQFIGFRDSRDL